MQMNVRLGVPVLLLAVLCLLPSAAVAQAEPEAEAFELYPEYVYGRNRGPKMGYTKPEVFDPLSDKLYRSGYKSYSPIGVPVDLKKKDAMTRVETMGAIIACADGWFWPFSRTARDNEPPGLEIEILNAIAEKRDWTVHMMWVNMATRFGPGAPGGAYDQSINKGSCDLVMGLTITGDDHHMDPNGLAFTRPFMSTGFVLVTQGDGKKARTLDDIKRLGLTVGLPALSPMSEYAAANNIPHETFFQNYRVIDALIRQKVDAGMIWSGAISQARLNRPEAEFELVEGYVPLPEMRWDSAWVVKTRENDFKKFIDESIAEMLESGEIKRIVERYGMPFFPPVSQ
jgi:ABC-type amino acid transport substrate-binding protein